MNEIASNGNGQPHNRSAAYTSADLNRQLAGQLQIANIALQDLDLDSVLSQILQTICALHGSPVGLLLLYNPSEEPAAPGRREVVEVDGASMAKAVADLTARCAQALVFWRGCVHDVLRPAGELILGELFGELGVDLRFAVATLGLNARTLGQVSLVLPGAGQPASFELENFAALAAESAKAIARARAIHEARQQRREAEALYQTVQEISAYLELDKVLPAIVHRAKDLLAADYAVLSVREADQSPIYLRATEGALTRELNMPWAIEEGTMSGLAMQRREVLQTFDYLADTRFPHTHVGDTRVSREGFRGVLVVPLVVADTVTGVLTVANRRPTHFTADNVKLLSSLANSAAVALEKARLYAKEKEAVAELQKLNALIGAQGEALAKAMHVQDQLTRLTLNGEGTEQIARTLAELVAKPVLVEDHLGRCLAKARPSAGDWGTAESGWDLFSRQALPEPDFADRSAYLSEKRQAFRVAAKGEAELILGRVMAPIVVGRDTLGYVSVFEGEEPLGPLEVMIVEQAATVFALDMAKQQAALEVELRLRRDFLDELLAGKYESEQAVLKKAPHFGYDFTKPQHLLVLTVAEGEGLAGGRDGEDLIAVEVARRTERGIVTRREEHVIVLVPVDDGAVQSATELGEALVEALNRQGRGLTVSVGIGRVCSQVADYAKSWREALACLTIIRRLGKRGQVLSFEELGVLSLLKMEDREELTAFVRRTLGPLQEYDKRNGSSLLQTVSEYVNHNGSLQPTAKALHVHVNTLLHRLQRVEDICGYDLRDYETRVNIYLALRIMQLSE